METENSPESPEKAVRGRKLLRFIVVGVLFALAAVGGTLTGLVLAYQRDLPIIEQIENYQPSIITQIFADDGEVIAEFAVEKRVVIPYADVPEVLRNAFVAKEDQRFWSHHGFDPVGILRAAWDNVWAGEIVSGASTITQQVSRLLFLTREETIARKIKEAILAFQIERAYTKEEIFTYYCNLLHFGHGLYGVQAASEYYFGKDTRDLTLEEAALIVGLAPSPGNYSPFVNPEASLEQRDIVLQRMEVEDFITKEEAERAKNVPLQLRRRGASGNTAPYFVEEVRQYLEEKYGATRIYRGGLRVYTTLNRAMQERANGTMDRAVRQLDKRQGLRPVATNVLRDMEISIQEFHSDDWMEPFNQGQIVAGVVTEVGSDTTVRIGRFTATIDPESAVWTEKPLGQLFAVGDVSEFEIASIDSELATMVVKVEQEPPPTGRSSRSKREPGRSRRWWAVWISKRASSTGRPRRGGSLAQRSKRSLSVPPSTRATPPLRSSSMNRCATSTRTSRRVRATELRSEIRRLDHAETPDRGLSQRSCGSAHAADRPAESRRLREAARPVRPDSSVSQHHPRSSRSDASGNGLRLFRVREPGIRMQPLFITKVTDRDGNVLEETYPKAASAIRADSAYIVTNLLRGVVQRGTGIRASRLGRPIAGKTGTTNDYTDAWFLGFDPTLVAGTWVGFDQKVTLGDRETGAQAALPAWIDFMEFALKDKPIEDFPRPLEHRVRTRGQEDEIPHLLRTRLGRYPRVVHFRL